MLGELVFEGKGKLNGMKRLTNGRIADELTVEGTLLGEEFLDKTIVEFEHRKDGTVFASIVGGIATKNGEKAQRSGMANGVRMPDGSYVLKGVSCLSFPPGKLARLNGIAIVWEANVTNGGTYHFKGWEWK